MNMALKKAVSMFLFGPLITPVSISWVQDNLWNWTQKQFIK